MAARKITETQDVFQAVAVAGPSGATPEALMRRLSPISRSTLNRRLAVLVADGNIRALGEGRATRYRSLAPFSLEQVTAYFAQDWESRPLVSFDESLLQPTPNLDYDTARRLESLCGRARKLDQKFLLNFLIDFSWSSSVLEGGTYTDLDTQALVEYGQRNPEKPIEDGLLILNHKRAVEYLWSHRDLDVEHIAQIQAMLTDRHNVAAVEHSDHFLPDIQRGVPREHEDVNLGRSAYLPPFRPGTGYVRRMFSHIVETAQAQSPMEAAFFLMTRIPYLQVFANGNKRTARLVANMPLLKNGLLPISFVDFDRRNYIQGMAAFYELGSTQIIANAFIEGYVRSILRGSEIPAALRVSGFDVLDALAKLVNYVKTGAFPRDSQVQSFIRVES